MSRLFPLEDSQVYGGISEQAREARARRRAKKLDLRLQKSRVRNAHGDNLGGWQIKCVSLNCITWGYRFELSLSDVEEYLDEEENWEESGVCCICGVNEYTDGGRNPNPVKTFGSCCEECDVNIVIPERLRRIYNAY